MSLQVLIRKACDHNQAISGLLGCSYVTCQNNPELNPYLQWNLELGVIPIRILLKARRINYYHYLLKLKENDMLFQLFEVQKKYPSADDWTLQVAEDLNELCDSCRNMKRSICGNLKYQNCVRGRI